MIDIPIQEQDIGLYVAVTLNREGVCRTYNVLLSGYAAKIVSME